MSPSPPEPLLIVVVDDEPLMLETTCRILQAAGHDVRAADSAEAAVTMVDHDVDLVVTDTALGGQSGPELRNTLAQSHPALPVLLMSGMEPDELRSWGVQPEHDPFLAKPFSSAELLATIATMSG